MNLPNGEITIWAASVKWIEGDDVKAEYDFTADIMSDRWNPRSALKKVRAFPHGEIADVLLDQAIFAGVGNIIKNEVLFNIRRHPLTRLSRLDRQDWPRLADAVHSYCWNFYEWKKKFELRKHWQVYRQRLCPLCERKLIREPLGKNARLTFYCSRHQPLYTQVRKIQVRAVLPIRTIPASGLLEPRLDH